jgi:hypothetical protein
MTPQVKRRRIQPGRDPAEKKRADGRRRRLT